MVGWSHSAWHPPKQSSSSGLHCLMQVVPQESSQVCVDVAVHFPPHATVSFGASQLAVQPPDTCILHERLPLKSKFPHGPWSSAQAVPEARSGATANTAERIAHRA